MRYGQQSDRSIPGVAYMDSYLLFWAGLQSCWHSLWLPGSIPGVCSRFHGVAAYEIDGIARISPLEHVGDKRLPALIRWLMTEGEARPNGCIDVSRSLPLVVKPIPPCRTSFRLGR